MSRPGPREDRPAVPVRRGTLVAALVCLALLLTVLVLLLGRDDDPMPKQDTRASSSSTTASSPSSTQPRPEVSAPSPGAATPTSGHDHAELDPTAVRSAKDSARSAPERAEQVMRLLAQSPQLGYSTWWSRTEGLLSTQGRNEMIGIDPERVPFRKVTGRAHLILGEDSGADDGHGDEEVAVLVPTDVGQWTVLLTTDRDDGTWRVSSIRAPEGVH